MINFLCKIYAESNTYIAILLISNGCINNKVG